MIKTKHLVQWRMGEEVHFKAFEIMAHVSKVTITILNLNYVNVELASGILEIIFGGTLITSRSINWYVAGPSRGRFLG